MKRVRIRNVRNNTNTILQSCISHMFKCRINDLSRPQQRRSLSYTSISDQKAFGQAVHHTHPHLLKADEGMVTYKLITSSQF